MLSLTSYKTHMHIFKWLFPSTPYRLPLFLCVQLGLYQVNYIHWTVLVMTASQVYWCLNLSITVDLAVAATFSANFFRNCCGVKSQLVWPKKNQVKQCKLPPSGGRWLVSIDNLAIVKWLLQFLSQNLNSRLSNSELSNSQFLASGQVLSVQ